MQSRFGLYRYLHRQKTFNVKKAKAKLKKHLKSNTFYYGREWPYKCVKPCIVCEEYLFDNETAELRDYKFFAFNGNVKAMFIATDRQNHSKDTAFDFYDREFNHLDIRHGHPNAENPPLKPTCFDKMVALAEKLSQGLPEVRVDFYQVNGRIFFGEMTLFHHAGFTPFDPPYWDEIFGSWISLPEVKK